MNEFIGLIVIFVTAVVLVFLWNTIKKLIIKQRQKKSIVLNYKPADLDFNVLKFGDIKFYCKETDLNPYTGQSMVMTFKSNFVPFKTAKKFIEENDENYLTYNWTEYDGVIFDHKYKNDVFSIKKDDYDIHNSERRVSMVLTIANLPILKNYIKEKNKNKNNFNYCFENFKWSSFCK